MNLAPFLKQRYFDTNANPLAAGLVYTYVANSTTPLATYTDAGGGTANDNPVVLDANGEASIWLDPTLSYKFVLKNSAGVTQWTVDKVAGSAASGIPSWNSNTTYSAGAIVADGSGYGLLYVSLTSDNLNNALTSVANWRVFNGHFRTLTANTTLAVTDDVIRSNTTAGALTMTLPACSTTPVGKEIMIKDVGTGGFTTTVKGSGSDQVDGAVTYASVLNANDAIRVRNNGTSWDVLGLGPFRGTYPTVQRLTAASGTYTLPTGAKWIRVKAVGGGGGGGGSTAAGGDGGNTTFGSSLLTANGGGGGATTGSGGAGGAATVNSPAILVHSFTGAAGQTCAGSSDGNGGNGASSPAGGSGLGRIGNSSGAGGDATGNGAGGGGSATDNAAGRGGGGAGAYLEAIITAPSATYAYANGAAGAAGSGTQAGGAGTIGVILVEEFYST